MIQASCPTHLLGDLDEAADRYNELWLELERSAESIDALRLQIMTDLFVERGYSHKGTISKVSQAYDHVRRVSGVLAYPGIDSLLAELKATYKLGLYTNGPTFLQWDKLKALGFDSLFDVILVAGDIGIYKPDPQGFKMLLDQLGVYAEDALFVGDNYEADIIGAHNVGMHTAWIRPDESQKVDGIQPTIITEHTTLLREVLL